MEKSVGDLLLGLKFIKLWILPAPFVYSVQERLGELRLLPGRFPTMKFWNQCSPQWRNMCVCVWVVVVVWTVIINLSKGGGGRMFTWVEQVWRFFMYIYIYIIFSSNLCYSAYSSVRYYLHIVWPSGTAI